MENKEIGIIKAIQEVFGIGRVNTKYIQDKMVIESFFNNISIILDSNYNIIDIVKNDMINEKYFDKFSKLSYPFDKYNISDIINMSKDMDLTNGIGSTKLSVRDELLTYMKFLNILIENYYSISYKMQSLGYDMPSVTNYIDSVINRISKTIIPSLRLHDRPTTMEVMASLGQKEDYIVYYNYIKSIINLYIDNMGLKNSLNSTKNLDYIDESDREDIKSIADDLLEEYNESKYKKVLK